MNILEKTFGYSELEKLQEDQTRGQKGEHTANIARPTKYRCGSTMI